MPIRSNRPLPAIPRKIGNDGRVIPRTTNYNDFEIVDPTKWSLFDEYRKLVGNKPFYIAIVPVIVTLAVIGIVIYFVVRP